MVNSKSVYFVFLTSLLATPARHTQLPQVRIRPQLRAARCAIAQYVDRGPCRWQSFHQVPAHACKQTSLLYATPSDLAGCRMCAKYEFEKPNDLRALDLLNAAAKAVVADLPDLTVGYGVSDEYSFVFHKSCNLFERRASKLISTVVSTFTAHYVFMWSTYFPDTPLASPLPTFDGRAVCYPSVQNLRDYLSWRQVDCHINNLYNTAFWALIQLGGLDNKDAEKTLAGTLASDKNELLFSRFHINYNNEPEIFRKGSVVFRDYELVDPGSHHVAAEIDDLAEPAKQSRSQSDKDKRQRSKARVVVEHLDIIKDEFWDRRPWILSKKPGQVPKET